MERPFTRKKNRAFTGWLDDYATTVLARDYYFKAAALNPNDIFAAEGLALAEAALEFKYHRLFGKKENPFDALPFFERAMQLGPNDVPVHLEAARYMKKKESV